MTVSIETTTLASFYSHDAAGRECPEWAAQVLAALNWAMVDGYTRTSGEPRLTNGEYDLIDGVFHLLRARLGGPHDVRDRGLALVSWGAAHLDAPSGRRRRRLGVSKWLLRAAMAPVSAVCMFAAVMALLGFGQAPPVVLYAGASVAYALLAASIAKGGTR